MAQVICGSWRIRTEHCRDTTMSSCGMNVRAKLTPCASSETGNTVLVHQINNADHDEWDLYVEYRFAPSNDVHFQSQSDAGAPNCPDGQKSVRRRYRIPGYTSDVRLDFRLDLCCCKTGDRPGSCWIYLRFWIGEMAGTPCEDQILIGLDRSAGCTS